MLSFVLSPLYQLIITLFGHLVRPFCIHSTSLIISIGNSLRIGEKCAVECYPYNLLIIDSHDILHPQSRQRAQESPVVDVVR